MGDAGRNGNAGLEQGVPQRLPSPPAARGTVGALRMPGVPAGTFITSSFRASSSPREGSVLCFCTVLPAGCCLHPVFQLAGTARSPRADRIHRSPPFQALGCCFTFSHLCKDRNLCPAIGHSCIH